MKETQLGSVSTLLKTLAEIQEKDCFLFFRGHADKSYDLKPSIYRRNEWISNEHKMIREVIMRCPSEFLSLSSSFEKLVKMQHYNLPTRLLDITENPLVALYFSCVGLEEKDKDGELIFFKIPKTNVRYFDSDTVSVVSNIAWAKYDFEMNERFDKSSQYFHHKDNHHAARLLHDIRQEKPHFLDRINPQDIKSVLCVKPKMDNPRLVRQDGAFLLFGVRDKKHDVALIESSWRLYPDFKRFIIKSADKSKIVKQLAGIGISKAKLFPEIDMVSQFIKDDYGFEREDFRSTLVKPSRPTIKVLRLQRP